MKKVHADLSINGIVQGVGFRPFIHKRVSSFCLSGRIRNTSFGVFLALEGERERVEEFIKTLRRDAPPLAEIYEIKYEITDKLEGYDGFAIEESEAGERRTFISPDVAVCDDCLSELFDKGDRRYRYPFINCTNCGPRFTITRDIPYDRKNTTMDVFPMCGPCAEEYSDIESRRYHAQPNACAECGPRLSFIGADGREVGGDAIEHAVKLLSRGGICAVKGLGGYHLACRADVEASVKELRVRKRRDEKPFAVMCRDMETVRKIAEVSPDEERLLTSQRRPIVLLSKRDKNSYKYLSENAYIGVMLPYTPMHHLLMETLPFLVMTSANISELPIIYKDDEAREKLSAVADGYLSNDREIFTRCDDSLAWVFEGREYFARRSRGYAPLPVSVEGLSKSILALGAEQKASFAISRDGMAFPSAHIGDLKNLETLECYSEQIAHFENIFDIKPSLLVCDMHPDYLSGEYGRERAKREGIPLVGVYHHHAHMASCMADNGLEGDVLGIIWDGTGYGSDGTSWGAEILYGGYEKFERVGTMEKIALPGGDIATKEVSRIGVSLLLSSGVSSEGVFGEAALLPEKMLAAGVNCPSVSSMGRLFDGVSAIIGIREKATFEGQAAMLLEAEAAERTYRVYPYEIRKEDGVYVFDWRDMVKKIADERVAGVDAQAMAAAFMNTLVLSAVDVVLRLSEERKCRRVVLSGGSFQNMYMLKRLKAALEREGISVFTHRQVSTNDEGISLGQLMIAERGGGVNVPCSTT